MKLQGISRSRGVLGFALALGVVVSACPGAQAQVFKVLHSFTGGTDGDGPLAGLAIDSSGNLYGTTSAGGDSGNGTVFKLNTQGVKTVLHSFAGGEDGADPEAGLILVGGNLYGTTTEGGAGGHGTVFEVTTAGKETVLYRFASEADGANPQAGLAQDAAGNLYGTTYAGGKAAKGVVYKLTRPATSDGVWSEEVLHSFGSGTDGANPVAGVTFTSAGNLYGTTSAGGTYGYGTVFELTPSTAAWTENVLHSFAMQSDGGIPYAGIVLDSKGNLYGAATDGGTSGADGGGTVFELTPSSPGWSFKVLYRLTGWGISGTFRNLLLAPGKIYATTHCDGSYTAGTVYELTPAGSTWTYRSLHVFTGGNDGRFSFSSPVLDAQGNLYGTTQEGGAYGNGVIFKVTP
jgi:uncharacterized repeat protein (TIGR03803 family)